MALLCGCVFKESRGSISVHGVGKVVGFKGERYWIFTDIHALNDSHLTLGTRDPFTGIGSVYSGVYLGGRWDFQANLLHATALLRIQHDKVPGPPTAAQLKRN